MSSASAVGRRDRPRHDEAVEEGRGVLEDAVGVAILEDLDSARRNLLAVAVGVGHVAPHLDDPEASPLVEDDRHRILDERLRGDEIDAEAGKEVEGLERLLRREHRRFGNLEVRDDVGLRLVLHVPVLRDRGRGAGGQRCGEAEAVRARRATRAVGRHGPSLRLRRIRSKGRFSRSPPAGSAPARRCRRPPA